MIKSVEDICINNNIQIEKNKFKRIEYIDIFKAIGIICMIMGHIGFGGKFNYFIHAFHMPMFFIISGYLYKKTFNTKQFLKKKIKTLLIPYFLFGIISYVIWILFNLKNVSISPLLSLISINTENLPIAGALWFLTALFFAEIIYFFIDKIKSSKLKNICIIIISLFGNCATTILPFRLPLALDATFVGVGLFHIGNIVKNYEDNKKINKVLNLKAGNLCLITIITIILIFTNKYVNMRTGTYGFIPLFWTNALFSTMVGINLSKKLENILNSKIKNYIISIGSNSIIYLCLNQIIIKLIDEIKNIFIVIELNNTLKLLVAIIQFLIVMAILYISDLIINKTKLKIIIGK